VGRDLGGKTPQGGAPSGGKKARGNIFKNVPPGSKNRTGGVYYNKNKGPALWREKP